MQAQAQKQLDTDRRKKWSKEEEPEHKKKLDELKKKKQEERRKYIDEQKVKNPPKPAAAGPPKKTLGKPSKAAGTSKIVARSKRPTEEKKVPEGQVLTNLLLEDVRSISYASHDHLVYEFAVRWWYSLPSPWPPVDYDYS